MTWQFMERKLPSAKKEDPTPDAPIYTVVSANFDLMRENIDLKREVEVLSKRLDEEIAKGKATYNPLAGVEEGSTKDIILHTVTTWGDNPGSGMTKVCGVFATREAAEAQAEAMQRCGYNVTGAYGPTNFRTCGICALCGREVRDYPCSESRRWIGKNVYHNECINKLKEKF